MKKLIISAYLLLIIACSKQDAYQESLDKYFDKGLVDYKPIETVFKKQTVDSTLGNDFNQEIHADYVFKSGPDTFRYHVVFDGNKNVIRAYKVRLNPSLVY